MVVKGGGVGEESRAWRQAGEPGGNTKAAETASYRLPFRSATVTSGSRKTACSLRAASDWSRKRRLAFLRTMEQAIWRDLTRSDSEAAEE